MKHASQLAMQLAATLEHHAALEAVDYPGLTSSASHHTATSLLKGRYGNMVTIHLKKMPDKDTSSLAQLFIERVSNVVPFCPSLGDARTTLSHPASTSHRSYAAEELVKIGVHAGTLRFSCGLEEPDEIVHAIEDALNSLLACP
jgi:cystathionine beta-lyase/cystathionine gamma-synthase